MKKDNLEAIYPLSPMQEGMLFHSLYAPQLEVYFEQFAYTLHGNLEVPAFKAAWQRVVAQHPVLRTLFMWENLERPLQVVLKQVDLSWSEHDWRGFPASEHDERVQAWLQADRAQGFDLARAPLLRLNLFRLSEQVTHFTWSFHHMLLDGWSVFTVMGQVFTCYEAIRQGGIFHLPASRPYRDYIAWLRQQDARQAESFWRETLHGFTAPTPLGIDRALRRRSEPVGDYHYQQVRLSETATAGLQSLARQQQLTLNTLVQGAWALLLSRYSGQQDVVFGVTVSGRPATLAGVESMVGLFINTLPLRTQIQPQQKLLPWLQELQARQAEARQYEYSPLVQVQGWSEIPRGQPLFESLLIFENYPVDASAMQESRLGIMNVQAVEWTNYPLTVTVVPGASMFIRLSYMGNRFDAATIRRMAGHFRTLLEGLVAQPEQRLSRLPLLTEAEWQQIVRQWNATEADYPQEQSVAEVFEAQVRHTPHAVAISYEGEQLSYDELNARANQLAHYMRQQGVRCETRVGICLERSLDMVVGLLAILKAGGAYVPLDLSYPQERLTFMLQDAQIPLLLTQKRLPADQQSLLARLAEYGATAVCLGTDWSTIAQQSSQNLSSGTSAENLAYVIYTSGSTGQPKGVQVQQRSILRLVCGVDYVQLDERQTLLQMAPVSFDAATFELWGALLHGGRCVLFAGELPTVQQVGEVLGREAVSTLWLTASLFNVLIDEAPQVLGGLRQLLVGGEALSVSHVRRAGEALPQVRLINGYGPTENTTFSCCYPIEPLVAAEATSIPIGGPIANSEAYVLDPQGQPVPIGVAGELYLGGAGLARGYLNRPELTAERFVPHAFSSQPGARLYRTGDRVRSRPDGTLEFLGRDDQQVKLRGFRIELGEIEAVLLAYPGIREVVVVLHQEPPGDKRLVAYVVAVAGQEPSAAQLRTFLGARLPDYMVPAAFMLLEALPLTPNGKLDRRALPAPQSSQAALDKAYIAPHTPTEELLAGIWATVLKLDRIGIHDNFFELGGDSILSIQIVARAHAAGLPLTPRHLFQHQTIAQLAAVVSSTAAVQTEQELVQGSMPLTPIQHWFFQQSLPEPQHWNQAILLTTRQSLAFAVLEQALHALLVHHDALRLRAHREASGWHLLYAAPDERVPFTYVDLRTLPEAEQGTALEAAASALQASLDLGQGPIVRAAFFDVGAAQPGRLLLVIHHLTVDIVSWPILLADLQTAYQQLRQGQPVHLPPKTTSFQHWAQRLVEYAQSLDVRSQLDFWLTQPWEEARPLPLDDPESRETNSESSARAVIVTLSAQETQTLLTEVPKAYHTQINEVLLTALVQAFARWTGLSTLLVHLEGHGREDLFEEVDLSRTVGWFTSLAPLVLTLTESQGPGEALKHVKEQLRGVPQSGLGFGLLRYLSQESTIREQLAALPQPQVSFNYAGRSAVESAEEGFFIRAAESVGVVASLRGQRPHVLEINGGIVEGQLYLEWTYSENLHRRSTIEGLAQGYLEALQALIRHCQSPQAGGYTPSDFPEARLSQAALDTLVATLAEAGVGPEMRKPNLEAIYPLSPMQEGMLFHSLYAPQSEVYFEQVAYTLHGDLDVSAFRAAWQQVVARHPILRTLFVWENLDAPLQVVRQQVELPWSEQDWRHLSSEEQHERIQNFLRADRAQGFDLAQAPLLRLHLIRLSEQVTHFTWSFHHLLLDGWSVSTILGEVFACYEATQQGRSLHLPTGRPYRDYIAWLQQQDLARAESFWREMLHGFTTSTSLGIDQAARNENDSAQDYYNRAFRLPSTTTAGLQRLARQQQLTLNTLVQGAWALLLSRYSGQQDVVFGVTVSGRPAALAGVESMVGLFINTLPLRAQVVPQQKLLPWLQALQDQQAEARQYEYSPLVQVQGWSGIPRGQPLFESLLIFENYPVDASAMQESRLEIGNVQVVERTNYPLTVTVVPETSLLVRISYISSRFTHEAIERMAGHFQTLLEGLVAQPEQHLCDVPLLTADELQQVLLEWNATGSRYPHDTSLTARFEEQVERTPEAIAVIFEEQQLSYGELNARANQLARHLQRLGVGTEVLVGLYLERSLDMVVGLLGILKAGGAYVPLDLSYPQERVTFMLADAHISVLLTQQPLLARLSAQEGLTAVCLDADWPTIAQQPRERPCSETSAEQLAYVIYTSGSTGQPKGVQVQQHSILRLVCGVDYVQLDGQQTLLQMAPVSFDAATFELWGALLHGGRCVLFAGELPTVQQIGEVLGREAVSTLWLTASLFNVLVDEAPQVLGGLRQLLVGGEALSVSHVRRGREALPQVRLINGYGPTENTTFSCCYPIEPLVAAEATSIPIGGPIANSEAYVLDPQGQPVPIGVAGELYLGGAGLARGYLNRPELTAERFVPHAFSSQPGARLYRTGDRVRSRPDGTLEFLGRDDQQVKLRGFRIELGEIEAVLLAYPGIREVVVVLHQEPPGDKRLVAYVVAVAGQEPSAAQLRTFLGARLPDYMVPAAFVPLEALPLTPNGKLDRRALPAPQSSQAALDKAYVAPHTPTERLLAQIWTQVLRVEQVSIHDNFFELGGDSILSIQIVARAHAAGLPLTPRHLFQHQTIAQLATVVGTVQTTAAQQGTVLGALPLTPIQHWFFQQCLPEPQHWNQAILLATRQPLDPSLLQQALHALLVQHDALRLRAQHSPDGWHLFHAASDDRVPFTHVDLTTLPEKEQGPALERAATALQASLDMGKGPIVRLGLFELATSQPARLLLVIHHLAVDIVSWPILLADLQTACQQLSQSQPVHLPPKTTSFQHWAQRLVEYAQSEAVRSQLDYWLSQPWEQIRSLPLDAPEGPDANSEGSARAVIVTLSAQETQALLSEVPRAYHTQINEVLLTALVQAFARWTGTPSLLVHLEGHGREDLFEDVDLSRTVGWFTSLAPLVLTLTESQGPGEALKRVKEQLRGVPEGGLGFGLLRYLSQEPTIREQLAALPQPQVSFNYAGRSTSELAEQEGFFAPARESVGVVASLRGQRPHVLEINGGIVEGQLHLEWTYSEHLHRRSTIEGLAHGYLEALQALIRHCQSPQAGGYTPSDFPLARLDEQKLRELSILLNKADKF